MKALDQQLSNLRQRVIGMGKLTQQMVSRSIEVLSHPHDEVLVKEIFEREEELDRLQVEIDRLSMQLMVLYCPVAADLRLLMSISRLTVELERIGDQAVNLCKSAQLLPTSGQVCLVPEVLQLAEVVKEMVADALDAFVQRDSQKAESTILRDQEADDLNQRVVEELLSDRMAREVVSGSQSHLADALAQVLIARSLERIGDQSTNICEEVVYTVKGEDIRHHHPEADPPRSGPEEDGRETDAEQ